MTTPDHRCPTCHDTGFYGDHGPGWRDNYEVMECECDPVARAKRVLAKEKPCKAEAVA